MEFFDPHSFGDSFDDEFVNKVHDLAFKLMSVRDMAVLLDIREELLFMLIQDGDNKVARAYRKGKAEMTLQLHEQEIDLANTGSAQGMANLHEFLSQMEADDM